MTIECHDLVKEFGTPPVRVIHGISCRIESGEFVSISGRSGSGKSTLLYLISTLDQPNAGTVTLDGHDPARMSVDELHSFRNRQIGFVFQFHYLLPELTALENVLLPARRNGDVEAYRADALTLLREFGIEDKQNHLPAQLSGGEQQRVAIARALIMKPRYLFADEPTGNLDLANGQVVMNLFKRINRESGTTIVIVTHEPDYAAMASRGIFLEDGRVREEIRYPDAPARA
jgi:putative ABC transport system ATP-binding protein/lipoprotein-releasing system ATP-binding protein